MGRNVGKTQLEEDLGRSIAKNGSKIVAVAVVLVVAGLIYSSRDYLREYGGVVENIQLENQLYGMGKRGRRRTIQVLCVTLRRDGETSSRKICHEEPDFASRIKERHRFEKPRFERYMKAIGEELDASLFASPHSPDRADAPSMDPGGSPPDRSSNK